MSEPYCSVPPQVLAAVFEEPNEPLQLRVFAKPSLAPGEVLVEITCCTICGSDLHTVQGRRKAAGPTILGHEIIGTVHEIEGGVCDIDGQPLKVGERVSWSIAASCGTCRNCQNEIPQKCDRLFKYGHHVVDDDGPLSGGLSQICRLVRGTSIVRVNDQLSDTVACPANCATATVAAALRSAGNCAGKSVLIHGAGMLGLTAAAMAHTAQADAIIVSDVSEERLNLASQFGATKTLVAGCDDWSGNVTQERDADIVFDMSGNPDAIESSMAVMSIGSKLILVGSVFPSRTINIDPEQIVRKLIKIEGIHNYTPADLRSAFEFLDSAHEDYPFESLVSSEFALKEIDQAIEQAQSSSAIRVAVRPNLQSTTSTT